VIATLATGLIVAVLVGAAWALALLALGRPIRLWTVGYLALVEVALLVQAVLGLVNLARTDRPVEGFTFAGYLIGSLLVLPVGVVLALAERSRWSSAVMLVAYLTVAVMIVRMNQVWHA
jgi:hypothetical protein